MKRGVKTMIRWGLVGLIGGVVGGTPLAYGKISGPCSDCHTMHNSQDDAAMALDSSEQPKSYLLKASCVGCHAQGGGDNIIRFSTSDIPQVLHANATDLAAGNFAYIYGTKGGGASDSKGHNVIDLGEPDGVLKGPPGGPLHGAEANPRNTTLTCSGLYGCHGTPEFKDPVRSLAGAHHEDSGATPSGDTVGNSYRFLFGITGLEVSDWQNLNSAHHNEYKGDTTQQPSSSCSVCHIMSAGGRNLPVGSSITELCMRCHSEFHSYDNTSDVWLKHPSDVRIPAQGEYASYTVYNVDAPVARTTLPGAISGVVTPSNSDVGADVVTCISCHKAHGTDHADILRWDYGALQAGGGSNSGGCFICHSSKDE